MPRLRLPTQTNFSTIAVDRAASIASAYCSSAEDSRLAKRTKRLHCPTHARHVALDLFHRIEHKFGGDQIYDRFDAGIKQWEERFREPVKAV